MHECTVDPNPSPQPCPKARRQRAKVVSSPNGEGTFSHGSKRLTPPPPYISREDGKVGSTVCFLYCFVTAPSWWLEAQGAARDVRAIGNAPKAAFWNDQDHLRTTGSADSARAGCGLWIEASRPCRHLARGEVNTGSTRLTPSAPQFPMRRQVANGFHAVTGVLPRSRRRGLDFGHHCGSPRSAGRGLGAREQVTMTSRPVGSRVTSRAITPSPPTVRELCSFYSG